MSDNSPYRVGGEPSKTRPSAPARLAPTRYNDAKGLVFTKLYCLNLLPECSIAPYVRLRRDAGILRGVSDVVQAMAL